MRVKFVRMHSLFKPTVQVSAEGTKTVTYGTGTTFSADSFPVSDAGGFGEYGITTKRIRKLLTNSNLEFKKNDGVGVTTQNAPEYKIVEVEKYSDHLEITMEEL